MRDRITTISGPKLLGFAAALALVGSLGIVACGGGSSADEGDASPSSTVSAPQASSPTPGATEPASSPTGSPETPEIQSSPTPPASQPTLPPPVATPTSAPPQPPPPPPPTGQTITVLAQDGKFNPAGLTAAANVPLTIVLNNVDANIAHDVRFSRDGAFVARSEIVIGPGEATVTFTPSSGTYKISCSVHRTMGGTLTVQ